MNESHESSRTNFENSTPELDVLVDIARTLPGVCGARLNGGEARAIVALCDKPEPRLSGRNWRGNMRAALRFSRRLLSAELRTVRISKRGTGRHVGKQSSSFARWNQSLRHSPTPTGIWRLSAMISQYFILCRAWFLFVEQRG